MSRKVRLGSSRRLGRDRGKIKTKTDEQPPGWMEEEKEDVMANSISWALKTEPISDDLGQSNASHSRYSELDTSKTTRILDSTSKNNDQQDVDELRFEAAREDKMEVSDNTAPSDATRTEGLQAVAKSSESFSHQEPTEEGFLYSFKQMESNSTYCQNRLADKYTASSDRPEDLKRSSELLASSDNEHVYPRIIVDPGKPGDTKVEVKHGESGSMEGTIQPTPMPRMSKLLQEGQKESEKGEDAVNESFSFDCLSDKSNRTLEATTMTEDLKSLSTTVEEYGKESCETSKVKEHGSAANESKAEGTAGHIHTVIDSHSEKVKNIEQEWEPRCENLQEDVLDESPITLECIESNMNRAEGPVYIRGHERSYYTITPESLEQTDSPLLGEVALSDHTKNMMSSLSQIPSEQLHHSEEVLSFGQKVRELCDEPKNEKQMLLVDAYMENKQAMINLEDVNADYVDMIFHEPTILNPNGNSNIHPSLQISQEPCNQNHDEDNFADQSDTRCTDTLQAKEKTIELSKLYENEKEGRYEQGFVLAEMVPCDTERLEGQRKYIDPFSQVSQAQVTENIQTTCIRSFTCETASLQTLQSEISNLSHQKSTTVDPTCTVKSKKMGSTRKVHSSITVEENTEERCKDKEDICSGVDSEIQRAMELDDGASRDLSIGQNVLTTSFTEVSDELGNESGNQFNIMFQSVSKVTLMEDVKQPEDELMTGDDDGAVLICTPEVTDSSQTLSQYAKAPMPSQSDDILSSYSILSDKQCKSTPYDDTPHQSRENVNSSQCAPLLESADEKVNMEPNATGRRRKMGSTRKNKSKHEEENTREREEEDATIPETVSEVECSGMTGTTSTIENRRGSTEKVRVVERGEVRAVTDTKDKGLKVRELHYITSSKEIEDSTIDFYGVQEKSKQLGDLTKTENLHHEGTHNATPSICETQTVDISCEAKEYLVDTDMLVSGQGLDSNVVDDNEEIKEELFEPKDNPSVGKNKGEHAKGEKQDEETGVTEVASDVGDIKCQFATNDSNLHSQSSLPQNVECQEDTKHTFEGRKKKMGSTRRPPGFNMEDWQETQMNENEGPIDHVNTEEQTGEKGDFVPNIDQMYKSCQSQDFLHPNNSVENPHGKRKKIGSRRRGQGQFNNEKCTDEHLSRATQKHKTEVLNPENRTDDEGKYDERTHREVVTSDCVGNQTLLCHDAPGLRQEVGSADSAGKIVPEQLEQTLTTCAGNASSAEQEEKNFRVIREKTQPQAGTSSFLVPGQSLYNIVMVGNSSVGKTSFLKKFQSGEFLLNICASIGVDTCKQAVTVDGKPVILQLWDTAGQERYRSITRQLFHKAQAILLMYDITSSQSFSDVRYWVDSIQEKASNEVVIMLLGNKSDCAERQVESHEGENLAKEYNIYFMECSAATGKNVLQSMEIVARRMKQNVEVAEEGSMALHKEPPVKKLFGCC